MHTAQGLTAKVQNTAKRRGDRSRGAPGTARQREVFGCFVLGSLMFRQPASRPVAHFVDLAAGVFLAPLFVAHCLAMVPPDLEATQTRADPRTCTRQV
jgi:hypothetical protein